MPRKTDRAAVDPDTLPVKAVGQYARAGWTGILEFNPGRKSPPPDNRTGYTGQDLDLGKVRQRVGRGKTNIGLRLPQDVVAIDVDVYNKTKGTKAGDKTLAKLEKQLGKLPPTWTSTARGADSPSRQYMFRIPYGTHLKKGNKLAENMPGIDLIQWFHRYTICWPSTNDEAGGAQYLWYTPDGSAADRVPQVKELPYLPDAWVQELTDPEGGHGFPKSDEVRAWLNEHDDGEEIPDRGTVARAYERAEREIYSGQGRHDVMIRNQTNLVRLIEKRKPGAFEALRELETTFISAVSGDRRPGEAEAEWERALAGAVGEVKANPTQAEAGPSWAPQNPDAVLAGNYVRLEPTFLSRNDGRCLLYAGKTHWISGEPESGKSWLALITVAQILTDPHGGRCLYIDYEDDMPEVYGRLLALGVPASVLRWSADRFRYVQPHSAHDHSYELSEFAKLLTQSWALVVLDAVTEALSTEGRSGREENELADWANRVPKRFAQQTGAAVVCIDHVVKSLDNRGRWAIGSQHKLAVVSGVAYSVDVQEEIAPGQEGSLLVWVAKDRIGSVRRVSSNWDKSTKMKLAARVVIDATDEADLAVQIWEPKDEDRNARPAVSSSNLRRGSEPKLSDTDLKSAIDGVLQARGASTLTELRDMKLGKYERVRDAVNEMVEQGFLSRLSRRGRDLLRSEGTWTPSHPS
jgi:bifunctional DNA primase/polymerase-like protein/AAA domain-containing protein